MYLRQNIAEKVTYSFICVRCWLWKELLQTDLIKKCYLKVGNFHKVSGIRISELNTKKKKNPQQKRSTELRSIKKPNGKQEDKPEDISRSKMLSNKTTEIIDLILGFQDEEMKTQFSKVKWELVIWHSKDNEKIAIKTKAN